QDIVGGAAVIFKTPKKVRDMLGGASLARVKKSKPPAVARVTPKPGEEPKLSEADKAEAFKNQGNTYYGLGQYPQAVTAYLNALKITASDPDLHNNLGATYLNLNRNNEAAESFKKAIALKPDDPEAQFNLGVA